jgi:hypothetical protein
MSLIRKISIGDNLREAMHYQVGGSIMNKTKKVVDIIKRDKFFDIYVCDNDDEMVRCIWKTFNEGVVSHVEYQTDF